MDNWPQEREKLRQDILKDIRAIRDRDFSTSVSDRIEINPKKIGLAGSFLKTGPFLFRTNFKKSPTISYDQTPITTTVEYVVLPYTAGWYTVSGVVEGFYIGLYALMDAPSDLDKHFITWEARGPASRYRGQSLDDWTSNFEGGNPVHLIQDMPAIN